MKKVYVAGKYSADNVIDVLHNIREGVKVSAFLIKKGYAPFCAWLDHQFSFYEDISVEQYYQYSIAFLKVCDCMLVLPDWQKSKGTAKEIRIAKSLKIPVYYSISDLVI